MSLRAADITPRYGKAELSAEQNLRVNTFSLILANVLTGAFGFLFWVIAARLFPAREVGVASALITSAVMLSTLSMLSIDTIYERFLPLAGTRARALLKHGFLLVLGVAMLSGAALVAFGPRHPMFETRWAMVSYPVLVMVLAVFTLQDKATVGLGVARWSAAKNSIQSVAKLIVLLMLAGTGAAVSIVLAWGVTAALTALCLLVAMHHQARSNPRFQVPPNLPSRQQLWSYFGSSFGITAVWAIGPLVVPLIVVTRVGAEENAYFAVAWAMISALYLAVHLVVSPYVAEVAAHPGDVASLSWRMVRTVIAVSCLGSVGLAALGPIMLGIVGGEYRAHAQSLVYLAALFVPLSAVTAVYEGIARVRRRLRLVLVVRSVATLVIVLGSLNATRSLGLAGVGWAYLAAESMSAVVLLVPIVIWLRRGGQEHARGNVAVYAGGPSA